MLGGIVLASNFNESRKSIRKHRINSSINPKNIELFLYGKLDSKYKAKLYCSLHECYLTGTNIKEKKCNRKKCRFRKAID